MAQNSKVTIEILTRIGYLPPFKAPAIRKRKDMVPERIYGFEVPPNPIPSGDIKKHINADVVVVGAGEKM